LSSFAIATTPAAQSAQSEANITDPTLARDEARLEHSASEFTQPLPPPDERVSVLEVGDEGSSTVLVDDEIAEASRPKLALEAEVMESPMRVEEIKKSVTKLARDFSNATIGVLDKRTVKMKASLFANVMGFKNKLSGVATSSMVPGASIVLELGHIAPS
jgi:hypothetical protein